MPSPTSKNSCVSDLNSFQPVTVEPNTTVDLRGCRVLAVDDDPVALRALQKHLQNKGCAVTTASDGESGLESITEDTSVALIDLRMPGLDGLECLHRIKKKFPALPVIILTASSEIASAVKAMKAGAFQYITKPFDPESLSVHVQKAHTSWQLSKENSGLRDAHGLPEPVRKLPTERTAMGTELLSSIQRISELNSTVFIGGESGTGKTTVARLIHQNGPRAKKPFVSVNCASFPRDLIESELFGHVKGAFTGAVKDRIGKAEIANGGTLFLDEIGDMPLELQPKLLTFLQDRIIQRVGCNIERELDLRLIVATHRDLGKMCRERRFRQDLYYRLNVLALDLQPLRERPEAIASIAESILETLNERGNGNIVGLSNGAVELLQSYQWPGNIRELENVLERAVAFCDSSEIQVEHLMFDAVCLQARRESLASKKPEATLVSGLVGKTLEEVEAMAILQTLESCQGNKAKSARMLGISEKSIYNKMKRLKINYTYNQMDKEIE